MKKKITKRDRLRLQRKLMRIDNVTTALPRKNGRTPKLMSVYMHYMHPCCNAVEAIACCAPLIDIERECRRAITACATVHRLDCTIQLRAGDVPARYYMPIA